MMKNDPVQDNRNTDDDLMQIRKLNIDDLINSLDIQKNSIGYEFYFFNRRILYDTNDFMDLSGEEVPPAIKSIFCQYFLRGSQKQVKKSGKWITFREFSGAGPLFSRFTENTNKTIEQTFANRLEALREKCDALSSRRPAGQSSYDLSVCFKALPKVPIAFQFNDADEILPANAALLFFDDAENYLDIKSLAAIATCLTGLLIQ